MHIVIMYLLIIQYGMTLLPFYMFILSPVDSNSDDDDDDDDEK